MRLLNKLNLELSSTDSGKTTVIDPKAGIAFTVVAGAAVTHKLIAEELACIPNINRAVISTLEHEYAYLLATMHPGERNSLTGQQRLASLRGALVQLTGKHTWEIEEKVNQIVLELKYKL